VCWPIICCGIGGRLESKQFFFEKKKQKTFAPWSRAGPTGALQTIKSFLLLFFKKEILPNPLI
jgi:hypothetical protein